MARGAPGTSRLAEVVESIEWPDGDGYFWMAGESAQMRTIRKHLMRDRKLPATAYDVMGYWRSSTGRQPRAVDPGPIWRAGKAQGLSDEQIWARYDQAESDLSHRTTEGFRSGFASFVGRPNAGKSTLTNALVGQKVVITSDKPQTTRTVVRGIVHRPDGQLVLVDTPGLHRPRTLLGERLNDLVRTTWAEVDVVAVCFPSNEKIGPGRPVHRDRDVEGASVRPGRGRHQDRPRLAGADRRAPARHPAARGRDRHRVGRDRPGLGVAATRSSCSRTCSSGCCRRARSSTRTATSPTLPRRSWSPS